MNDYSPGKRTAVVLTGSGIAGAYHAGVLRALDESGVKVDVLIGSGAGVLGAAFAAVAGGDRLYGPGGFWDGVEWRSFFRLRTAIRVTLLLLGMCVATILLPLVVALLVGVLSPLVLAADAVFPGHLAGLAPTVQTAWEVARAPYLVALLGPLFVLVFVAAVALVRGRLARGRRFAETFEFLADAGRLRSRLRKGLWDVARGASLSDLPPEETELGRRYVGLALENMGQPGFRELVLRVLDLETGRVLPHALLAQEHREAFAAARAGAGSGGVESSRKGHDVIDLSCRGHDASLLPAVLSGLLPVFLAPVLRVTFPRGAVHGGERHRLADATFAAGCGLDDAVCAGAEQLIVVSSVPAAATAGSPRRGARALLDALLAARERQALEQELWVLERLNRMIATLGHAVSGGQRAWEDPATGRVYRPVAVYVIRPRSRPLQPLDLDGARDPATEVVETPGDLLESGYRDAYRLFIEPVVGAPPEGGSEPETSAVEVMDS